MKMNKGSSIEAIDASNLTDQKNSDQMKSMKLKTILTQKNNE